MRDTTVIYLAAVGGLFLGWAVEALLAWWRGPEDLGLDEEER